MSENKIKSRILVVDDDRKLLNEITQHLQSAGYSVTTATDGMEGLILSLKEPFDLVLTDIRMPRMSGREMVRKILMKHPSMPIIVITAYGNIQEAVRTIKEGVMDYIIKPFNWEDLSLRISRALEKSSVDAARERFREKVTPRRKTDYIITQSKAMDSTLSLITLSSRRDEPVIILGEDGTEKDKVARAVHFSGKRSNLPFVEVNCGIFTDRLIWSELIGDPRTEGHLISQANTGTLHLEDIQHISISQIENIQNILKKYYPHTRNTSIRFILSLNPEEFRSDEFQGIIIKIPPLRERRDDIPLLAYYFLEETINEFKKRVEGFTDDAIKNLISYTWPGNLKELHQKIRDAVILTHDSLISSENLLLDAYMSHTNPVSFKEAKKRFEKDYVISVMRFSNGNVSRAAQIAHKDRKDFYYLMRKHRINPRDFR